MSYIHQTLIAGIESDYNDMFDDIVVTKVYFLLNTLDLTSDIVVVSPTLQCASLPAPTIDNFILYQNLDRSKYLEWINNNYDMISLQNSNIALLNQ